MQVRLEAANRLLTATLEHGEPLVIAVGAEVGELRHGQPRQLFTSDGRITDAMSVVAIQRLALERTGGRAP